MICREADLYGTDILTANFLRADTVAVSDPLHVPYHTQYPEQGVNHGGCWQVFPTEWGQARA